MDILKVQNLTKKFNNFVAVDNISFSLKEGEILGFLGPNGAGKTTTIQMLLDVLTPTSGEIHYFGKNLQNHREEILEQINFSSTYTNLPWDLTVKESLIYTLYFYNIKGRRQRLSRISQIFNLAPILNLQIHDLSAGQLTRVNLAKAFLNFPKVLLLDEPTASLDPDVAAYIREFLLNQRQEFQVSIIITSHNMAEVEEICDRVIFIDQGKIIADDTPEKLARTIDINHVKLLVKDGLKRVVEYCHLKKLEHKVEGRYIIVNLKEKQIPDFLNELVKQGISYNEIAIEKPNLEDFFLQIARKES